MLGAGYVEYIHDELLAVFWPSSKQGATAGIRDRTLIESAVARPFSSAFGEDIYPTVLKKGIALFHSLVSNHAFVDGNKRTALIVSEGFLRFNGLKVVAPPEEKYLTFLRLAEGSLSEEEMAAWFTRHAVRL